ncbi:MAG TPA: hypothetical protein VJA44_08225 [Acidimicrobiia bacterium]|nr:hypothetical protein [Acidimicrobiia bacterium]
MLRARLALLSAFLLLVAACGGGTGSSTTAASNTGATTTTTAATTTTTAPTTTTTQAGFEVTSEDGDLTVEVPFDAMAEDPGITIRVLAPEEYPPELAGAAENPDARIYNLEPEGLQFAAPVTVTRRIDAERFGDLEAGDVPIVVLLTRTADGVYEPYSDLRVVRNGEDVFVSGTTPHFSPVIALSEQQTLRLTLDDYHLGFGTELGTKLDIGYRYYDADENVLDPPTTSEPVGFSRSIALGFDTTTATLGVACSKIGEAMPRLGVNVTLDAAAPAGQVGLRSVPGLIPSLTMLEVSLKVAQPFSCFDPLTSILGLILLGLAIATDHPGGIEWIAGGDFHGGNSGAYLSLADNPRLEGAWGGLIMDGNGNGFVDSTDTMYPPSPLEEMANMYAYVAALYTFGAYFVYLVDGAQYSGPPIGSQWTVGLGLEAFRLCYTGSGRFESSIGYVGVGGLPFLYEVGPGEEQVTPQDPIVEQFNRMNFQF